MKDIKAKNYLFQAIDRSVLETILKKDTAKEIWDFLKKKYKGTTRVKRAQLQALRKEFEVLHMKAGETINDYFGRTLAIANKMRLHGERMEDEMIVEKILRSMTSNMIMLFARLKNKMTWISYPLMSFKAAFSCMNNVSAGMILMNKLFR